MTINLKNTAKKWIPYWCQMLALITFLFSLSPTLVNRWYSKVFFHYFSSSLRWANSLFPFAIGEWVYFILLIILIFNSIKSLSQLKNKLKSKISFSKTVFNITKWLSIVYVLFSLLWGLNYLKPSPAVDFKLKVDSIYTEEQVDTLSLQFISQLNESRSKLTDADIKSLTPGLLIQKTIDLYKQVAIEYNFLKYSNPSIKLSAFPVLGDYIGYLAFYQPITGEAIIRGDLPILTQPFTISHEIAHQLGYASETEANFIAFMVAKKSHDPLFHYSMQLQLFTYSQEAHLRKLAKRGDFEKWKQIAQRNKTLLSKQVIQDRREIKSFFLSRQNQRISGTEKLYDQFLQWNKQAKGIESYNEVLLWALAYNKLNLN